ncbi:MAG TPA: aminoacyl-tRNA hydrolase [Candidatus Limnocylindria bacterium]|nr:aminoacyl-tRNA hydrolase [Candidatus Limnocylindria bacterium]
MRLFSRGEAPHADRLVVGLGNPGDEYSGTRHNVGYQVASRLAKRMRAEFKTKAADARIAIGTLGDARVAVARPGTFMNDSGHSVRRLLQRYRLEPKDLVVVYDDIDLPLGRIRIRPSGGPGTHNGMRSVVAEIGSESFPRVRLGIHPEGERGDLVDHVLSPFEDGEREQAERMIARAAEAIEVLLRDGIERAMARFNRDGEVTGARDK